MESYTVEAILSATDKSFTSTVNGAKKSLDGLDSKYEGAFQDKNGRWRAANGRFLTMKQQNEMLGKSFDETGNKAEKTSVSMGSIIKSVGAYKLIDAAINTVKSSLGGAIERYDKLSQFPKVLEGLGASTKDAASATNKLKDGIDGLPTTLQDVASTTQQMYSVFKDADKAADSTIALNNALLASGSTGDKAARGTEQYLKILRTGKVDMDSFTTLQETMGVGLDKVAAKFGKTGESAQTDLYAALQSGEISIKDFNSALIDIQDGLGGTAELAKSSTEGIGNSFTNMRNAVVNGLADMLASIDQSLKDNGLGGFAAIFDRIKAAIKQTFNSIKGFIPPIMNAIAKSIEFLGKNADWLVPILIGLAGSLTSISVINGVSTVINNASRALGELKAAAAFLISGPGLIIVAIAAVIAIGILVVKNWDTIKAGAKALWDGIKDTFGSGVDWVVDKWNGFIDGITSAWDSVKQFFSNMWDGLVESATTVWNNVVAVISPFITTITNIFQPLIDFFGTLWENIMTIAVSWWEIIKSVVMAPILFLIDLITGNFTQLQADMMLIWTTISTNAVAIWNSLVNIIVGYVSAVVSTVVNIFNTLKDGVINIWNAIVDTGRNLWQSFTSWLSNLVSSVKDAVVNSWDALKQGTINIFNSVVDTAVSIWDGFKQRVSDIIDGVVHIFDILSDIDLVDIGMAIIDGFVDGLKSAWDAGMDFIGGIGDWIRDHKGPITYDRKLLIPAGNAIIDGLNKGLEQKFKAVKSTVSGMTDYFANTSLCTTLAVDTNYGNLQSSLSSANMSLSSNNELTLNESKKPANIQLNLGGTNYTGFVSDISSEMAIQVDLNRQN